MLHRNSQKRILQPGLIYFITTVTKDRYPYFENDLLCQLFIEELKLCKKSKGFKMYAFCILHDHIHLMVEPNDEYNISHIMKSLKENFSRDANKLILTNKNFLGGDTSTCRLQIRKFIEKYKIKHSNLNIQQFEWQKSYFDHYIRNNHDFDYHIDYTIWNFQKHNHPENWEYTSLNFPELIDDY
jgi:REP element-mobilizing transposase RayT